MDAGGESKGWEEQAMGQVQDPRGEAGLGEVGLGTRQWCHTAWMAWQARAGAGPAAMSG